MKRILLISLIFFSCQKHEVKRIAPQVDSLKYYLIGDDYLAGSGASVVNNRFYSNSIRRAFKKSTLKKINRDCCLLDFDCGIDSLVASHITDTVVGKKFFDTTTDYRDTATVHFRNNKLIKQ